MDELVPNPDGCSRFEPHAFKKDKCKHCTRLWTHHKGVISPDQVAVFVKARQKALEEKAKAEAEAAAKAQAKARAAKAKKQNRTAEDAWFFEGRASAASPWHGDSDSEGEAGFKMLDAVDLFRKTPSEKPQSKFKVTNLIDFSECAAQSQPIKRRTLKRASRVEAQLLSVPEENSVVAKVANTPPRALAHNPSSSNEALHAEIRHLRQRLEDAQEEMKIQVEIVRDEVAEKEEEIDALKRRCAECEASLHCAQEEIATLRGREAGERPAEHGLPASTAALLSEIRSLAARTKEASGLPAEEHVGEPSDIDTALRSLLEASAGALAAAQSVPAAAAPPRRRTTLMPLGLRLKRESMYDSCGDEALRAEIASNAVAHNAANALQEVIREMQEARLSAERNFAWISKCISGGESAGPAALASGRAAVKMTEAGGSGPEEGRGATGGVGSTGAPAEAT